MTTPATPPADTRPAATPPAATRPGDAPPISGASTIYEITERYPATVKVLVDAGLTKMADSAKRQALGRTLTVEAAARLRGLDPQILLAQLQAAAAPQPADQLTDLTLEGGELQLLPPGDLRLSGLLPCPVRLPLLEAVDALARRLRAEQGLTLGYSLTAASVGGARIAQAIAAARSADDLPEVFVSAGFETFFDQRALARFADQGLFTDVFPPGENPQLAGLGLRDPRGRFTLLAVVPAVFLVNHAELDGLEPPRRLDDLLEPRYAGKVALPVADFDLFNALLLTVYRRHGEAGVTAFGQSLLAALHPAQTVGRFAGREVRPPVAVVPAFFSRLTGPSARLSVVWPEDGAVLSPIFMLVQKRALPAAAPVAELFCSRQVGELLGVRGRFPSLHPAVDNGLPPGTPLSWIGWDFIHEHDLGQLIPRLNQLFGQAAAKATPPPPDRQQEQEGPR